MSERCPKCGSEMSLNGFAPQCDHCKVRDMHVYHCDEPISNDHPSLADVPEVAELIRSAEQRARLAGWEEAREACKAKLVENERLQSCGKSDDELKAFSSYREIWAKVQVLRLQIAALTPDGTPGAVANEGSE